MTGHKMKTATAMAALVGALWSPAKAQTQTAEASAETAEIVVTARKREESIKDVPLTINAFSAEQLQARDIRDFNDLSRFAPGINFIPGNSRLNSSISIRGMTQVSPAGDNRRDIVTTFIDGVPYVGNPSGIGVEGVERIEVIKGPQSALFGRATFGGAISIITRTPGREASGRVSLTAGTYDDQRLSAYVETPIAGDVIALGLAGEFSRFGGFYKNALGGRLGESDRNLGVATLAIRPSDTLDIKVRYSHREDEDGPAASALIARFPEYNCGPFPGFATRSLAGLPASITTVAASRRLYCGELRAPAGPVGINTTLPAASVGRIPFSEHGLRLKHEMATLSADWDVFEGHTISAVASSQRQQIRFLGDFERTAEDRYQLFANNIQKQDFFEGRITSPGDQRIQWMVGASKINQDWASVGAFINGSLFGPAAGGPPSTTLGVDSQENESVYASVGFDITERFNVSAEARRQKETVTSGIGTPTAFSVSTKATLPRFILRYAATDETSIYANYARGNQPTAGNASFFALTTAGQAIAEQNGVVGVLPEAKVDNYELGIKHYADDRSWFVNVAAFYSKWVGRQGVRTVQVDINRDGVINLTGVGANREVFNASPFAAGDSNTRGIELESGFSPTEAISLGLTLAYADTKITKALNEALLVRFLGLADGAGRKFSNAPELSGSAFAEYRAPLTDKLDWFARTDVNYVSKRFDSILNTAFVGDYWRANLRGGLRTERYDISVWVTNLFNSKTLESASYNSDSAADPFSFQLSASEAVLPRKRQFGLSGTVRF
jgi:iron complex outermembrane recepter protein